MTQAAVTRDHFDFPAWVPPAARHYVIHTEMGLSIRALARDAGCHASTVMRQIRRFETRRDDPLVDDALRRLAERQAKKLADRHAAPSEDDRKLQADEGDLSVLQRLSAPGAVLAIARGLDKAVIAFDGSEETETVDRVIAERLALGDLIAPLPGADVTARLVRYRITPAGRQAYRERLAEAENRAGGFADASADFSSSREARSRAGLRSAIIETPLSGLSRRRDRDGKPFLEAELVRVGERLREDFELSDFEDPQPDLGALLSAAEDGSDISEGCREARTRVREALKELGPELGDVAFRCCCLMEGMEQTERRKGWSARSGKIVLRIALQQLKRHYEDRYGIYAPMIG